MQKKLDPYVAIASTVYIMDGVAEALIHIFEDDATATTVAALLNDAYSGAYQDGWLESIANSHPDVMNKLNSLSIRNQWLEKRLNELGFSEL